MKGKIRAKTIIKIKTENVNIDLTCPAGQPISKVIELLSDLTGDKPVEPPKEAE